MNKESYFYKLLFQKSQSIFDIVIFSIIFFLVMSSGQVWFIFLFFVTSAYSYRMQIKGNETGSVPLRFFFMPRINNLTFVVALITVNLLFTI